MGRDEKRGEGERTEDGERRWEESVRDLNKHSRKRRERKGRRRRGQGEEESNRQLR